MEIKDLIEITPEIKMEAQNLLSTSTRLKELLKKQGINCFSLSTWGSSPDDITIYDRHEYSEDGEGNDLGFFVHKFYSDGEYRLNFVAEESEEAQAFKEAFDEAQEAEDGEDE